MSSANAAKASPPLFGARASFGLAAISGVVYFLGFPGVNAWPLALVAHVPLLLALHGQAPRRAALLGLTGGFFISVTGFYWLYGMLRVFSGMSGVVCALMMMALCLYQGGRTALLGFLTARAAQRGWPLAPSFALAYAASELLYPLLFPWYFGASAHNAPVFLQVADVGGPYLVSLVLLAPSLAIADWIIARREGRTANKRLWITCFAVPALAAAYGVIQMSRHEARAAKAPSIEVGIAQGDVPLFGRSDAVQTQLDLTAQLKAKGVDLVVWSEAAIPTFYPEIGYQEEMKKKLTSKLGVAAMVGAGITGASTGSDVIAYNTSLMADKDGNVIGRYDKRYLLAFGEYLPFGDTFPVLYEWSPNSGRYEPGKSLDPITWGDHKLTTMICYEDILPHYVNDLVRHGDPDLLVNMTNDAWFGDTTEPLEHLALAQLRAVEHRRYLVRATNSGISAIVDPMGRLVVRGGVARREVMTGKVAFLRGKTAYEVLGDKPFYMMAVAIGLMALVRRERLGKRAGGDSP